MKTYPGPKPSQVNRKPNRVHDQKLQRDLRGKRVGHERKPREHRGVDRVGFGIDDLQYQRVAYPRDFLGVDEGDLFAGEGDASRNVEQVQRRQHQQGVARPGAARPETTTSATRLVPMHSPNT